MPFVDSDTHDQRLRAMPNPIAWIWDEIHPAGGPPNWDHQLYWPWENVRLLGKPQIKKCRVYLGIAQIAIAPPPLHSNGHSGALYFRTDLSKCHLNFNFHCISAPNHPGKGSDPPNQANAPLNMDNSSQK